jgi:pimeloyl-ACP methyl ester carboxylesterase
MQGQGPAVVLISGLSGTMAAWSALVEAFGDAIQTVCFDQRGLGGSERGTAPVSVATLADDVWEIVDQLGLEAPVLCGHSTGGAIVQEMALKRSGAAGGLVLSGTWAGPDRYMQALFEARLVLLETAPRSYAETAALFAAPTRWQKAHPAVLEAASVRAPDAATAVVIRERIGALLAHDCRDRLAGLEGRALVVGAEDDMIVPVHLQEEVASLVPGSDLHLFGSGGHSFPTTRAAEMAALVRRWMAEG